MFSKELHELWIGGKALTLILVYTVLLGVMAYILASNSELSLIPPKEMVFEVLWAAIAVGLFISLIIGADTISGERERATLEGLLLTPTSRRQIVTGKFLAAVSPWPVALIVAVPYMKLLSQGDEVFGPAVFWGAVFGSLLAPAFTALGMFVSFWCNANKNSLFVSLGLYVVCLVPSQLPGSVQTGRPGRFLQWINPMQAPNHFLEKTLVNNRTFDEVWHWLTTPVLFALIMLLLVFGYAGRGLRLEAGRVPLFKFVGRFAGASVIILGLFTGLGASTAKALQVQLVSVAESMSTVPSLAIAVDMEHRTMRAGDYILFNTELRNNTAEPSPPLIAALNIINLNARGDVVDPEDWSPQRTQYVEDGIAPGGTSTLSWRVNAIFDGNYMVYLVVIPAPGGPEATSRPVASSGIHLTVTPFQRINPGGVLPYAIGGPVLLLAGIFIVYRMRRRQIDLGGSSDT